jgi:hypothetical protein
MFYECELPDFAFKLITVRYETFAGKLINNAFILQKIMHQVSSYFISYTLYRKSFAFDKMYISHVSVILYGRCDVALELYIVTCVRFPWQLDVGALSRNNGIVQHCCVSLDTQQYGTALASLADNNVNKQHCYARNNRQAFLWYSEFY